MSTIIILVIGAVVGAVGGDGRFGWFVVHRINDIEFHITDVWRIVNSLIIILREGNKNYITGWENFFVDGQSHPLLSSHTHFN